MRQRRRPCQKGHPGLSYFLGLLFPHQAALCIENQADRKSPATCSMGALIPGSSPHQPSASTVPPELIANRNNTRSSVDLKGLGDKTDPELPLPPLPELSAKMPTAGAGRSVRAEIACKTAIDKPESIWPLQPSGLQAARGEPGISF